MISDQEVKKLKEDIAQLQADNKKLQDILLNINDDPRFKAKVRKQVIDGTTSAGLPIIVDYKGTRWSITNVTKLN